MHSAAKSTQKLPSDKALSAAEVVDKALINGQRSLLQKSNPFYDVDSRMVRFAEASAHDFFNQPLVSLVDHPEAQYRRISYTKEDHKIKILNAFERFLAEFGISDSITEDALMIADELYTNSIRHGLGTTSKRRRVTSNELFIARDQRRVVIGNIDLYGTLNIEKFLGRIQRCFRQGVADAMNMGEGGAGIGSYMIYNRCSTLVVAVERNRRTIFACTFPIGKSAFEIENISKNLILIQSEKSMKQFQFSHEEQGDILNLKFEGAIDEESSLPKIDPSKYKTINIDLKGVQNINSIGIRDWVRWIKPVSDSCQIRFLNVPRVMVNQFNSVFGFLPKGAKVESILMPLFCEKCDTEKSHLIRIEEQVSMEGNDIHLKSTAPELSGCKDGNCACELDVMPAKYFQFLKRS